MEDVLPGCQGLVAPYTKFVIFGQKALLRNKPDLRLMVGNEPVERVLSVKYLGVILDEYLTFEEQITHIYKKASKNLGILYKSRLPRSVNKSLAL